MKNIHVLPTKPNDETAKGIWIKETRDWCNIYITNDEYIGLSYYLDGDLVRKGVVDDKDYWKVRKDYKKIILTTDPDLIKDGVQAIDDEFLEWFVKNPSCEVVEVKSFKSYSKNNYIIFIPKEEPKQETLEEVELALLFHNTYERLAPAFGYETKLDTKNFDVNTSNGKLMVAVCKEIIKWQQQQNKNLYSEEDMTKYALYILNNTVITPKEWFEQFKKK